MKAMLNYFRVEELQNIALLLPVKARQQFIKYLPVLIDALQGQEKKEAETLLQSLV